MTGIENSCEDEWFEIRQRFEKEGLDYDNLKAEEQLLHVWRWLVDAESNLRSSRRQLDKLRDLRCEEMEEMESYIGHIRDLAEKRADHLESESISLRTQLETTQQHTSTLTTLLEKNGLECTSEESVGEQVAFLIADRAKLTEEIEILKKIKFSNGVNGLNKEGDLLSEIIKVSSEKEVLKREVAEMYDRVQLLEKASRQLEVDNERLAFKLSEALAELEERETQLKHLGSSNGCDQALQLSFSHLYGLRPGESPRRLARRSLMLQPRADSPASNTGEVSLQPPAQQNQETSRVYDTLSRRKTIENLSEAQQEDMGTQTEIDHDHRDLELHKSLSFGDRDLDLRSHSVGADSTPPSLLMSEVSCGSPKKLASLLDSQIAASRSELIRLEEIKKLQSECERLKSQLAAVTEKYNNLAMKHIQLKSKRKSQVEDLRNRLDVELSTLQCQVENLQSQLSVQKKMLATEEGFRERVEVDYRQLQEEKRSLMVSVMHLEGSMREKDRELNILGKKITLLENTNSDLLAKVLQLKYTSSFRYSSKHSGAIPKSNSVEGILTDLGTV